MIRGNQAYLPNIAASPDGPLRFNVDTQAFVNVIDGVNGDAADRRAARQVPQPPPRRARARAGQEEAVLRQRLGDRLHQPERQRQRLRRLGRQRPARQAERRPADGKLSFTVDADTTRYIDLNDPANPATERRQRRQEPAGHRDQPGGHAGLRDQLRVAQRVGRRPDHRQRAQGHPHRAAARAGLAGGDRRRSAPRCSSPRAATSTGPPARPSRPSERLSSEGWQSCASCHFEGLTDGVVWEFGAGPRKSVPLNATFNPRNRNEQRVLNYSAIFDEVEDFEVNIRNVSGPGPLAARRACQRLHAPAGPTDDEHLRPQPRPDHRRQRRHQPGAVRDQRRFAQRQRRPPAGDASRCPGSNTAVPAATALREWVQFAVRTPDGPVHAQRSRQPPVLARR